MNPGLCCVCGCSITLLWRCVLYITFNLHAYFLFFSSVRSLINEFRPRFRALTHLFTCNNLKIILQIIKPAHCT